MMIMPIQFRDASRRITDFTSQNTHAQVINDYRDSECFEVLHQGLQISSYSLRLAYILQSQLQNSRTEKLTMPINIQKKSHEAWHKAHVRLIFLEDLQSCVLISDCLLIQRVKSTMAVPLNITNLLLQIIQTAKDQFQSFPNSSKRT